MKISVVIPVYNAAQTIAELVNQIAIQLNEIEHEMILVNDGSSDNSSSICECIANERSNVKFISLRKNFGEHNAVICGLSFTSGDYVVIIDDDFQNPPAEIHKLISEIEKGYDVVYSKYIKNNQNFLRIVYSQINNLIATFLLNKPKNLYLSSFKVINRDVVNEIIKYKGPFPYIDGLILRVTDNIGSVLVTHNARLVGRSNYTFFKLLELYLNMFINFSIKPMRMFTLIGVAVFLIGIIMSISFTIEKLYNNEPPGWTSTVIIVMLFSGFQIIFLGVIGEYLGKLYLDKNNTPQWVMKHKSF